MATQVILLERVEKLGNLGDVVSVKPGYARNYLLPQKKALRASKENIAYFEAQKASIEKANADKRQDAEKQAKKVDGTIVSLIRQASEAGQLFGSVSARDIAESVSETTKETIERSHVVMNTNFKTLGLFPVEIALHPEVKVSVTVNIARSDDEAKIQAKTGKAVIAQEEEAPAEEQAKAPEQDNKADMLEESALEAEKIAAEEQAVKDAEDAKKAEEKAAKKAAKAEAETAEEQAAEGEEAPAEEAEGEGSKEEKAE